MQLKSGLSSVVFEDWKFKQVRISESQVPRRSITAISFTVGEEL